jgi:hypothetical protein
MSVKLPKALVRKYVGESGVGDGLDAWDGAAKIKLKKNVAEIRIL